MARRSVKEGLHPRNRFRTPLDFGRLVESSPALAPFVARNVHGDESIDFSDPKAVKALNQALLRHAYGVRSWDLPEGSLCPGVPGRSDYLHHLADLLEVGGRVPRGRSVAVLDVGVGANCVYPLIGASEYGWRFVGTEIDPVALRWARGLVEANPALAGRIECRFQASATECFEGVVEPGETFAASICNPPFHTSREEAAAGSLRKLRNLGGGRMPAKVLNFGGKGSELWCPGGELGFVRRMIAQSARRPGTCLWFTTLVSKAAHLPGLRRALKEVRAVGEEIEMVHGQKKSRILAWSFLPAQERRARLERIRDRP